MGIGAATVAILRLPLSAVVLATLLTTHAGNNVEPLIIVGVVVSYIVTLSVSRLPPGRHAPRAVPVVEAGARPGTGRSRR